MSLLVSGIFGDEMEVFSADDKSSVHLGRDNGSGEDTATDGDETSEWALFVCKRITLVHSSIVIHPMSSAPFEFQRLRNPPHIIMSNIVRIALKIRGESRIAYFDSILVAKAKIPRKATYQYRFPRWRSLVSGIPNQHPYTIFDHLFRLC